MKLSTKLIIGILGGLLAIYLVAFLFQQSRSMSAIAGFSTKNISGEEGRQWEWIERIQTAINIPLFDTMAEGEMDKFDKYLTADGSLSGLQEFSLYDARGRVVNSTDPGRKGKELPPELKEPVLVAGKITKRRTATSFEIYEPLHAEKRCIECHVGDKEGEIRGAFAMRFSSDALAAAEATWVEFEGDFRKSNLLTAALTAFGLALGAGLLVSAAVRYLIAIPVGRISNSLSEGSDQVASASGQISSASQSLADGANQQSASLEETSASLEEIASMTKRNAENALNAKDLSSETKQAAETGSANVQEMNRAMGDIQSASSNISKIIKTIDEIAFQTNILALNAAVEAARAGEAGAGFAVVADEVRNLAQRSAQAAKETAEKIEDSIAKSANGVAISGKVTESLTQIVTKARQVDALVAEIATASREQSQGLDQINAAVTQMDKVTQATAATAGETASASEELNAQAATLRKLVAELQNLVSGSENIS